MRRSLALLNWLIVPVSISLVYWLAMSPDVESSLGVPICAGRPHETVCRYCAHNDGRGTLPPVIDAANVLFFIPSTADKPAEEM